MRKSDQMRFRRIYIRYHLLGIVHRMDGPANVTAPFSDARGSWEKYVLDHNQADVSGKEGMRLPVTVSSSNPLHKGKWTLQGAQGRKKPTNW